ncbi:peptide chain release factor N(5)-glutamine methyltransferase [Chloroflexota bacterium]
MTLIKTRKHARDILVANNIDDAQLECDLLLRDILKIDRVQLYLTLHHQQLSPEQEEAFWKLLKRRLKGEPTAYILRHREFYGLDFFVDPRVLIPRPESELLLEIAFKLEYNRSLSTIADIGTGCGAIAISLALNLPQSKVYATDISATALEVALVNCKRYEMTNRISLLQGDMLEPLPEPVDLIIANLPYVKELDLLQMKASNFEPLLALNGGADGTGKIHQLCHQLYNKLRPDSYLLLEIGAGQSGTITRCLRSLFTSAKIEIALDLNGIERVVCLKNTLTTPLIS